MSKESPMTNSSVDIRLEAVRAAQALLPDKVADLLAYAREIETYLRGEAKVYASDHASDCATHNAPAMEHGVHTS